MSGQTTDQRTVENTITLPTAVDLSANQFEAIDVDSTGVILASAGGRVLGALYNAPDGTAGDVCEIITPYPVVKWRLGGTVTMGDAVKADSSGRAVTADSTDVAAGSRFGVCIKGGAVNEYGSILFMGADHVNAAGNEIVSAAGAISLLVRTTFLSIDGTKAYTLGSGLYDGQRKTIRCISATNTPAGTITGVFDTDGTGTTGAAFNAAADQLELEWDTAINKWRVLQNTSVTLS